MLRMKNKKCLSRFTAFVLSMILACSATLSSAGAVNNPAPIYQDNLTFRQYVRVHPEKTIPEEEFEAARSSAEEYFQFLDDNEDKREIRYFDENFNEVSVDERNIQRAPSYRIIYDDYAVSSTTFDEVTDTSFSRNVINGTSIALSVVQKLPVVSVMLSLIGFIPEPDEIYYYDEDVTRSIHDGSVKVMIVEKDQGAGWERLIASEQKHDYVQSDCVYYTHYRDDSRPSEREAYHKDLGLCAIYTGQFFDEDEILDRAHGLNPMDPELWRYDSGTEEHFEVDV